MRVSIQDRTVSEVEAKREREDARMKRVCVVSVKERGDREGVAVSSAPVISMKMADPSLDAVHPVNVGSVMVNDALEERETERAPPFNAAQRVNVVVDPVMERDVSDVRVAETAAPSPSLSSPSTVRDRSEKLHESIVADAPERMETAEAESETGVLGVFEATQTLLRWSVPLSTETIGHGVVRRKSIC